MRWFFEEVSERLLPITICIAELCACVMMVTLTLKCLVWVLG